MKRKRKSKFLFLIFTYAFIVFALIISSPYPTLNRSLLELQTLSSKININKPKLEILASQWSLTEVISTESTNDSSVTSIAVDNFGNVHLAWQDTTNYNSSGSDYDIFYKCWNVTLSSWTVTEVVSTECVNDSGLPSIAVDVSGNVHVAWNDDTEYGGSGPDEDIFYKIRNATTGNWTTIEVVSTESSGIDSSSSEMAIDNFGNIHIAWRDDTNYTGCGADPDIFYKRRNATTGAWTLTEVVSTESTSFSTHPTIAVDNSINVHIAWPDFTNYTGCGTDPDIFYKRWNATTGNWTTTEVVSTESTLDSRYPKIALDGSGNLHAVWEDQTDYANASFDMDIFYKYWNATTDNWTITEVVSDNFGFSSWPTITIDSSGNIHVAWEDNTDYLGSDTDLDIFYRCWNSTLDIWTTTEVISTESTDDSYQPSIAVNASGYVHIAWSDRTDYGGSDVDKDIFYKYQINVTVPSIPTANQPEDIITTLSGSETIGWILWDAIGPGKYRVWANDTNGNFYVWVDWTDWVINNNLQVPINRTDIGVFNYTIEFNNSLGNYGFPNTVIITIDQAPNPILDLLRLFLLGLTAQGENNTIITLLIIGSIASGAIITSTLLIKKRTPKDKSKKITKAKRKKGIVLDIKDVRKIFAKSEESTRFERISHKNLEDIITKPLKAISREIYIRVQNLKNLSKQEKELLIEDLATLDDKEIDEWLRDVEELKE